MFGGDRPPTASLPLNVYSGLESSFDQRLKIIIIWILDGTLEALAHAGERHDEMNDSAFRESPSPGP